MNWKFFATMAAGMIESAGISKVSEDENNTGTDDVIGEGLIYAAKLLRWLVSGAKGNKPSVPDSLK